MATRYLTTTLPYVNDKPHMGHALEFVQADALARTWRLAGHDVFFSTGTDEHGQKIAEASAKAGKTPQAYVDEYAEKFRALKNTLGLSNDAFIRTTDEKHIRAAQEMWRRCADNGDIYKKSYSGLYCVGCEAFKTEKELENGTCPLHPGKPLEHIEEQNYFFKFSAYQERLIEYLSKPKTIIPEWRRAEAIAFVQGGLEDFSISREKKRLSWGIPVPNDESQVMYVWYDALTNYVSTLGWPESDQFQKYWIDGLVLQMAGKDQIRFQSLMWQAMLLSAGVKNSDTVFYHGFITSHGQKMSKSLGNVIDPLELVEKYGTDAVRYVLLRHISPNDDSDLTLEAFQTHYNAHLTNGLGNLVARVMKLAEDNLEVPVVLTAEDTMLEQAFFEKIEAFRFNEAMDLVFDHIAKGDAYITEKAPYKTVKTNPEEGRREIETLVHHIAKIATHLRPVLPQTAERILEAVRSNKKPENLFPRI